MELEFEMRGHGTKKNKIFKGKKLILKGQIH
jgi:hypothetical protein